MTINAIILAAGQGTRMRSQRAKVLHTVGGLPMLSHVLKATSELGVDKLLVVYGHDGDQVRSTYAGDDLIWVHQQQQLGTGHAVKQALADVENDATVLVLYGDIPLIQSQTMKALLEKSHEGLALLTVILDDPAGYGRIIRNDEGAVVAIVEHKDASDEQLNITEVNTGILAVSAAKLRGWLDKINNNNAQGEYYLTDIIELAAADGIAISPSICPDAKEVMGINNRLQQAEAERAYQQREANRQMLAGVTMVKPETVTINGELRCGSDVVIEQSVIFNGKVAIGNNVEIGPFSVISNSSIGDGVIIQPHSVIDNAVIGNDCRIGPFARIRPETTLAEQVHVGNFVEIKKSSIAAKSKINHLSYIGDTIMGSGVNVGAGTITCNYDGANKFQTRIEDNVFIGSDTQLVAPVTIGAGATIGAGSTITRDVDAGVLELSRSLQKTLKNWKRPSKKEQ
jgi:bifunctional UDP-N-acetylglucosamine pyrophosphorylase/glucosamine-1-phosphate N-acetyltransferase